MVKGGDSIRGLWRSNGDFMVKVWNGYGLIVRARSRVLDRYKMGFQV